MSGPYKLKRHIINNAGSVGIDHMEEFTFCTVNELRSWYLEFFHLKRDKDGTSKAGLQVIKPSGVSRKNIQSTDSNNLNDSINSDEKPEQI